MPYISDGELLSSSGGARSGRRVLFFARSSAVYLGCVAAALGGALILERMVATSSEDS